MRSCVFLLIGTLTAPGLLLAEERSVSLESAVIDLSEIEDRTDLTFEESPAYYGILGHVRHVPQAALVSAADELRRQRWRSARRYSARPETEFPTFVDLIEHPDVYRGRPVTLRGHVIRLVKYPAGPNDAGIDTLYEAWLVTADAQQHPSTIVCTEIPKGMPIGEKLINGVSVTGYFFKLRTYPSRDKKIRFAPMILARTMSWRPPPEPAAGWTDSPLIVYGGLAVVALTISILLWISSRRHRASAQQLRESLPDEPLDFLKSLTP